VLLIVISAGAIPPLAQSYREAQIELQTGNLLVQDQAYTTTPIQTLFHSQTAAGTDTEAFGFGRNPDGSISLAQTNAAAADATDTGFYTATFSFLKFCCPTGEGFLHTSINDPIVSRTPVFAGLIFPQMIKTGRKPATAGITQQAGTVPEVNDTMNQSATGMSAPGEALNTTSSLWTEQEPVVKKQISTAVGVEDTTNLLAVTPRPTTTPLPGMAATAASTGNVTNQTNATIATPVPTPEPSTILPKSTTLLVKPMNRQSNKPFTDSIDPDYNPRKATRSEVRNISGWNRLTTNVIGRSGIDSTYMNRTAYPEYINPWNVVKLADQFKVMSDSANMTKAGSYLQQRLWAL
jgi:hypothetical protein